MDCREYIDNCLSADVDGELTGQERLSADQHLAGCENCRAVVAAERLLRSLVQSRAGITPTPPEVRARILQALDREAERACAADARRATTRWYRWAPLAIAAAALLVVATVMMGRHGTQVARQGGEPAFDWAIGRFDQFERSFSPNARGNSTAALTDYLEHNVDVPTYVWDFERAGFTLVGSRIDQTGDKGTVIHTLYRGPHGDILCSRYRPQTIRIPAGGRQVRGIHYLYAYKGHSICLTIDSQVCCILVSQLPLDELSRSIDEAES